MSAQKYTYGDVVKVIQTGQTGTVKAVDHTGDQSIYQVQLEPGVDEIASLPEGELQLIRLANEDETGLNHIRYIS